MCIEVTSVMYETEDDAFAGVGLAIQEFDVHLYRMVDMTVRC